jgi:DNA polymerase
MGPAETNLRSLAAAASQKYVPLRGNTAASLCLIGEAPGENEEREGKAFSGASGQLLIKMTQEVGLKAADYWITNVFKIRPPDNDLKRISEIGIPEDAHYLTLLEELYAYKPKIIVAVGGTAGGYLCPSTIDPKTGSCSVAKWHGSLLQSPKLQWPHYVCIMEHPAYILRMWSEKPIATFCLARAKEELDFVHSHNGSLNPLPERSLLWNLSPQDACDWVQSCIDSPNPVSMDIELSGKRIGTKTYYFGIDMIALAKDPWNSASINLFQYDDINNARLWHLLDRLLSEQRIIGQNEIGFDAQQLRRIGFEPNVKLWVDCMVLHHNLWIEMPHGLHFLGMAYTRSPYWKDDSKLWTKGDSMEAKSRYNALDAAGTYEVCIKELEELAERIGYDQRRARILEDGGHEINTQRLLELGWPNAS